MKNNKPLTKKQRERLAKEARRESAAKAAAAARVKTPVPRETKWFIALVAAILVLATLSSMLFGFLVVRWTEDPYATVYDTMRLKDYLDTSAMGKSFYSGLDFDMSSLYRGEATDEELEDFLYNLRLSKREEVALEQKNTVIGYGDDVVYYIIGVKDKDGKAILTDDFASSSYTSSTLTVGKEAFGEDFDKTLAEMGLKPSDTELQMKTHGTLTGDEVVIISLNAYKSTAKTDANDADKTKNYTWSATPADALSNARLDLSSLKEHQKKLKEALAGVTLGEDVSFVLEGYNLTGDSSADCDAVRFDVMVHAAVTETAKDIPFTVPEGYFAENDAEDLYLLNGKTVTFSVIIPYMNDYEVPELNAAFVTETMEFETEETDKEAIVAAFREAKRDELNQSIKDSLEKKYVQVIFNNLAAKAKFVTVTISDEMWSEQYVSLLEEYRAAVGRAPTSEDELNSYAYYTYGATDYNKVLESNAQQMIVMYYIFRHAGLRITDEMMEEAYREYVDGLIAAAGDEELYNEAHFVLFYSEEILYRQARTNLVHELVSEYLLSHNNIITEKAK